MDDSLDHILLWRNIHCDFPIEIHMELGYMKGFNMWWGLKTIKAQWVFSNFNKAKCNRDLIGLYRDEGVVQE